MAGEALTLCGGGFCGFLALLFAYSWSSLAPTEMALRYNYVLSTVSNEVVAEPGLKFVGPFSMLLKYPKTIQTMEYNAGDKDLLDGRTKDGLPLILGIAFQYRLLPDGLYKLYHEYDNNLGDYVQILQLQGIHLVTELATHFTAYEFFNEKQKIAEIMRTELDKVFLRKFYATVDSLQINEDDLPGAFTDTILMAATSKQNITRMAKTRDAKVVEFQTLRVVAEAQANVTIQQAHGERHRIAQSARADAAIIEAFVEAELQAYGRIRQDLALSGDSLLKYIWYDTLAGGGVSGHSQEGGDVQMFVGVSPAAYISPERVR